MKTMKSLIVATLLLGFCSLVHAGGRAGRGWNVTIVTGTVANIGAPGTRIFLRKIVLSSGTTASSGDYMIAYSSTPGPANGGGIALFPNSLFNSTAAVTPALVFMTTTTVSGVGSTSLNNVWSVGECEECYVEIGPGEAPGSNIRTSGALHIRKSAEASGGANQAAVYWSE